MINRDMRYYDFFTFGDDNGYGQPQLSQEIQGSVKMAINIITQAITENIKYKDSTYIGLTHDALIDDTYVIKYGDEMLKVLYVNPKGRMKQVFMGAI